MQDVPRLEQFEKYAKQYSLIRLDGKRPVEPQWKEYQSRRRPFQEIGIKPQDNAGIISGSISGLLVLDVDDQSKFQANCLEKGWEIPETFTVQTGRGGHHYYFKYPEDGKKYGNRAFKKSGFDIRGDGGYIVAPGSVHPDTQRLYSVEADLSPADPPDWLTQLALSDSTDKCDPDESIEPEEVDLDTIPVRPEIKQLILEGRQVGGRSEAIITVLNALIKAEVPVSQIAYLFEAHPIGEKYHEKGSARGKWLLSQIRSARKYIKQRQPSFDRERILQALGDSERGDSLLFRELYKGRLCFDHSLGQWFNWVGHHWEEDIMGESLAGVDSVGETFDAEAKRQNWIAMRDLSEKKPDGMKAALDLEKKLIERKRRTQELKRRENILILAASGADSLGIRGDEWDSDPMLLGCRNGVINLRDGSFREGGSEDYIRTVSPTEWQGLYTPATNFERFLSAIFQESTELTKYIRRLFGYAVCGATKEHILPILFGQGRNGKGTLLEVIKDVLGPLAGPIRAETLLDQKYSQSGSSHTADLMVFRGKRIVWASETDEGRFFSVAKAKWLVGGDTIVARPPHGKRFIEFRPSHTLFLLTNSKPHASAEDFAFWQRVHLIPFELSFVDNPVKPNERKRDTDLPAMLKAERSGILAWLIRGYLEWQEYGLNPPDLVKRATSEYQQEEDVVGRFIEECCIVSETACVRSGFLYDAYRDWCKVNGHKPFNSTNFGKKIGERFHRNRSNGILYSGIGLPEKQLAEDSPF